MDAVIQRRRGTPGWIGLALGVVAAALVIPAPGLAAVAGLAALAVTSLELLEVHRPGLRQALAGFALGAAALMGSAAIAMSRSLDLGGFADNFLDAGTIADLGSSFARGVAWTVVYAVSAEIIGIVFGLLLAIFAIQRSRWVRLPAVIYIDIFRGTPLLMQLMLIYFGLPFLGIELSSLVAGIVGLSLNSSAYVAEIFRAGIQSVERGQMEAARSLGLPYRSAMRYVIVPQAFRRVIPPLMNEFVALLKDSSLVSILGTTIGTREILKVAQDAYANTANATPFIAASLLYLAMTVPLTRLVNRLDRKLRRA